MKGTRQTREETQKIGQASAITPSHQLETNTIDKGCCWVAGTCPKGHKSQAEECNGITSICTPTAPAAAVGKSLKHVEHPGSTYSGHVQLGRRYEGRLVGRPPKLDETRSQGKTKETSENGTTPATSAPRKKAWNSASSSSSSMRYAQSRGLRSAQSAGYLYKSKNARTIF